MCKSVKYLMLHIRDCPGRLPDGSPCPFPWCRPCKQLLNHLVRCSAPSKCPVCSPWDLPSSLNKLKTLNIKRDQTDGSASSSSVSSLDGAADGSAAAGAGQPRASPPDAADAPADQERADRCLPDRGAAEDSGGAAAGATDAAVAEALVAADTASIDATSASDDASTNAALEQSTITAH